MSSLLSLAERHSVGVVVVTAVACGRCKGQMCQTYDDLLQGQLVVSLGHIYPFLFLRHPFFCHYYWLKMAVTVVVVVVDQLLNV